MHAMRRVKSRSPSSFNHHWSAVAREAGPRFRFSTASLTSHVCTYCVYVLSWHVNATESSTFGSIQPQGSSKRELRFQLMIYSCSLVYYCTPPGRSQLELTSMAGRIYRQSIIHRSRSTIHTLRPCVCIYAWHCVIFYPCISTTALNWTSVTASLKPESWNSMLVVLYICDMCVYAYGKLARISYCLHWLSWIAPERTREWVTQRQSLAYRLQATDRPLDPKCSTLPGYYSHSSTPSVSK